MTGGGDLRRRPHLHRAVLEDGRAVLRLERRVREKGIVIGRLHSFRTVRQRRCWCRDGELLRLIVRPQEVVAAIIALNTAYQEYSGAVSEYNVAQFEVYRALGQPAQWVTCPPGQPAAR